MSDDEKTRRNRSDSVHEQQKIVADAMKPPLPPPVNIDLGDGVLPYWEKIVDGKARSLWTDQDLILVVELSRNLFRTQRLSLEMLTEDEVIEGKANPKSKIIDELVKRARMIYAMLQIHPEATCGKSNKQIDRNKKTQNAKAAQELPAPDNVTPLIPGMGN